MIVIKLKRTERHPDKWLRFDLKNGEVYFTESPTLASNFHKKKYARWFKKHFLTGRQTKIVKRLK